MTLPTDPTLFLAHCKAHKTPTKSQPCKELKMPTHSPRTPADVILISIITNTSTTYQYSTHHAHPPPSGQTQHNWTVYRDKRAIKQYLSDTK